MVQLGIERLIENPPAWMKGARLGLLSNQASTATDLVHTRVHLQRAFPGQLACLFSPQHGFFAEKQDNMIESTHQQDPVTGLTVYSLYGESRKPDAAMYEHLDVLLIDIVDVGTRVYTFLYTMAYCLELAAELNKKVVVLDRPNPIGGEEVEGNILEPEWTSFVGLYPLPMRHGLTFGELAIYLNQEQGFGADLEVVAMEGWRRSMYFEDTGLPWVYPSPNMPTPTTALVYPGQVIWEGTMLSEGRGTALPFELFGAPYLDCDAIIDCISSQDLQGCNLRPVVFEPTSGKYAEQACNGFHLHVTEPRSYKPYRTSLALLQAVRKVHKNKFQYKSPPYEYEFKRLPMDLILGSGHVREQLEGGAEISKIENDWQPGLTDFSVRRQKYFLYPI